MGADGSTDEHVAELYGRAAVGAGTGGEARRVLLRRWHLGWRVEVYRAHCRDSLAHHGMDEAGQGEARMGLAPSPAPTAAGRPARPSSLWRTTGGRPNALIMIQ